LTPEKPVADDPAALAQRAFERIRADPGHLESWALLFLSFAGARDFGAIEGLVSARQAQLGDGLGFFYYVLRDLLTLRRDGDTAAIVERIGGGNILFPVATYVRGLVACRQGRSDEAVRLIKAAAALLDHPAVRAFTAGDKMFADYARHHIAAQASFLMPVAEVLALDGASEPPAITFTGDAVLPGDAVLVAACDRGYFARFAAALVASVGAVGGVLHLHVVAPDAATEAAIAELTAAHAFLRVSTEAAARDSAYYACSRFLVAPALLDRYRRKLLLVDVDVVLAQPLDRVAIALDAGDVAWREVKDQVPVPSLHCDARLVGLNNTPGCRRFLGLLGRYLTPLLDGGAAWMVDQAGLYCVSRALAGETRVIDLAPMLGTDYGGLIVPVQKAASTRDRR
jgi:hypothetical protein